MTNQNTPADTREKVARIILAWFHPPTIEAFDCADAILSALQADAEEADTFRLAQALKGERVEMKIETERLAHVSRLKSGSTEPNDDGAMCVMEAVAYVAGEPWSDHPECACPVLTAFMVAWNDGLPSDAERNRLLMPLIPRLVGTRGSEAIEARRANMAADWFIRVQTPAWLRLAGLTKHADLLASFPEITDFSKCPPLMPALKAARADADAAWAAAWAAASTDHFYK